MITRDCLRTLCVVYPDHLARSWGSGGSPLVWRGRGWTHLSSVPKLPALYVRNLRKELWFWQFGQCHSSQLSYLELFVWCLFPNLDFLRMCVAETWKWSNFWTISYFIIIDCTTNFHALVIEIDQDINSLYTSAYMPSSYFEIEYC